MDDSFVLPLWSGRILRTESAYRTGSEIVLRERSAPIPEVWAQLAHGEQVQILRLPAVAHGVLFSFVRAVWVVPAGNSPYSKFCDRGCAAERVTTASREEWKWPRVPVRKDAGRQAAAFVLFEGDSSATVLKVKARQPWARVWISKGPGSGVRRSGLGAASVPSRK